MIPYLRRIVDIGLDLFRIDLRSLALFRIGLGLIIIGDLIVRVGSLTAHYSDYGILPRGVYLTQFEHQKWYYSIHYLSGEPAIIALLFILAGIFALGYTLGYKTKTCAILSFIFLVSLQNRNDLVLHGGDAYLRVLLFWSLFLPLSSKWSLDNWRLNRPYNKINSIVTFGSLAILVQIVLFYVSTGLLKNHSVWTTHFTAVYYALNLDHFTAPLGLEIAKYNRVTKLLTILTLHIEKYGMILMFIPFFTQQLRLLGVIIFIGFHIGIHLTMDLGIFHYVCLSALFLFLPSCFWDTLLVHYKTRLATITFFNKVFNHKGEFSNYIKKFIPRTTFAEITITTDYSQSSRLKNKTKKFYNRCLQGFAAFLIIYVILWNLRELDSSFEKYLSYEHNWIARVLRIDQRWELFSPYPMIDDGWFIVSAHLNDDTQIDLFRNGSPVTYTKPKLVSADYKDERWQKYMIQLWYLDNFEHRKYYLDYLYRSWGGENNKDIKINKIELIYMLEKTPPMGREHAMPEKVYLLERSYEN